MSDITWTILITVALMLGWRLWMGYRSPAVLARLRAAITDGARLIDVRTPAEHSAGHPSGAINIPLDRLAARLSEVGPKDQPVVLCCQSGSRSRMAARVLRRAGFAEVLDGGPERAFR